MPERDETRPKWPIWYGFAALGIALVVTLFGGGLLFAVLNAAGAGIKSDDPGVNIVLTLIQDAALAGSAVWVARQGPPPPPGQVGPRSTPFPPGAERAGVPVAVFFRFPLVFIAGVHPPPKQ